MPKTTIEIMKESEFNYLAPSASIKKCEETDNRRWYSEGEINKAINKSLATIISPKCEKPYGDTCGYCSKCKLYQETISKRIYFYLQKKA